MLSGEVFQEKIRSDDLIARISWGQTCSKGEK